MGNSRKLLKAAVFSSVQESVNTLGHIGKQMMRFCRLALLITVTIQFVDQVTYKGVCTIPHKHELYTEQFILQDNKNMTM